MAVRRGSRLALELPPNLTLERLVETLNDRFRQIATRVESDAPATGDLNMGGFRITNLGDSKTGSDALSQNAGDRRYLGGRGTTITQQTIIQSSGGGGGAANVGTGYYELTADFLVPLPIVDYDIYTVFLKQDSVGGWVVTWNAAYHFVENFQPDPRPDLYNVYQFVRRSSEYWLASIPIVGVP